MDTKEKKDGTDFQEKDAGSLLSQKLLLPDSEVPWNSEVEMIFHSRRHEFHSGQITVRKPGLLTGIRG